MSDLNYAPEVVPLENDPVAYPGVATSDLSLTSESAFLLQTYVRTVATWMDCFDHDSTYQLKIPQLVIKSPLLFHGVCAFTANHLALSNSSHGAAWKVVAVKHYGEALNLLIDALSLPSHEHALTASMLLLSYEIHGALRSEDYRRHFLGLAMLIKSRGITAQSTGTDRANFWIYIRHEIVVAMASEKLSGRSSCKSWKYGVQVFRKHLSVSRMVTKTMMDFAKYTFPSLQRRPRHFGTILSIFSSTQNLLFKMRATCL